MFNLPPDYANNVSLFTLANVGVDLKGFQVWKKPKGASMIWIVMIGGGGGGGGGFSRAAGSAGGGGGSGACSGTSRYLLPAIFLPDQLFIQVGQGGLGGAASVAGANGLNSYIYTSPTSTSTINLIGASNTNPAGGGGGGTAGAGGAAGASPSLAANAPFHLSYAITSYQVGIPGVIGGAQTGAAGGNTASIWANYLCSPGASGAGCTTTDFNGGRIVVSGQPEFINWNIPSGGDMIPQAVGAGANGSNGLQAFKPLVQTGGGGGASNNSGLAGLGGDGGIGCGGGGGGAGTTGGRGGNGGSGMVLIIAW